jgi:hypothetical protein
MIHAPRMSRSLPDLGQLLARPLCGLPLLLGSKLLRAAGHAEGWWFDLTRGVRTEGNLPLVGLTLAGRREDGFMYAPARVSNVRRALWDIPILNHSAFTFVDLGSGKGRILFLAAEHPYRRILGVEFARELHLQAEQNILSYRARKRIESRDIESLYADAGAFAFPDSNLVLYCFNPFPLATMQRVLDNLRLSLDRNHDGRPERPGG